MKNNMLSKGSVVTIILLFISVSFQPVMATVEPKMDTIPIDDDTVEISVSRYRADSSIEKYIVELSKGKVLDLREKLRNIECPKRQLSLLKEYGLIPEEVKREQLQQEMLDLADELDITDEIIESVSERYANNNDINIFGFNFLNEVFGLSILTLNLPIGLSFIIGVINSFTGQELQSIDLMFVNTFFFGVFGFSYGLMPDFGVGFFGIFALLGFIGYVLSIPFISPMIMQGFSVASFALGRIVELY